MRSLRAKIAPFTDAQGAEIYDGNIVRGADMFGLFPKQVVYERGKWWLFDFAPFYIDNANRYTALTAAVAKRHRVTDDKVRLA